MCQTKDSGVSLLVGLTLGAVLGTGATFLFGTRKGKQVRRKIYENYPEFFDEIRETLSDLKETLGEKYADVAENVAAIETTLSEAAAGKLDETKEIVTDKITSLGMQMEELGRKIQTVPGAPEKRRFFKRTL